jgi:hypothetical protein
MNGNTQEKKMSYYVEPNKDDLRRLAELADGPVYHPYGVQETLPRGTKIVLLDGPKTRGVILKRTGIRYYDAVTIDGLRTVKVGEFEAVE